VLLLGVAGLTALGIAFAAVILRNRGEPVPVPIAA
jgi:hypothetical protein